ncbi:MAG: hypothetical protein J5658_04615 [Prevotella sp.]|nr:hypothetical protein [Prevotella sp.]
MCPPGRESNSITSNGPAPQTIITTFSVIIVKACFNKHLLPELNIPIGKRYTDGSDVAGTEGDGVGEGGDGAGEGVILCFTAEGERSAGCQGLGIDNQVDGLTIGIDCELIGAGVGGGDGVAATADTGGHAILKTDADGAGQRRIGSNGKVQELFAVDGGVAYINLKHSAKAAEAGGNGAGRGEGR